MSGRIESYFNPEDKFQAVHPSSGRDGHPFYIEVVAIPSTARFECPFYQMDPPLLLGEGSITPSMRRGCQPFYLEWVVDAYHVSVEHLFYGKG